MDITKFKKWLSANGAEIIPETSQYEAVRFKGKEIGVLYTSGKVANDFTDEAIRCFRSRKKWSGKPINVGRNPNYKKEKAKIIERDGSNCFYCGNPLEDDITLEHLISLSSGGQNSLSNMVLAHEKCNQEANNMHLNEKVKLALGKEWKLK